MPHRLLARRMPGDRGNREIDLRQALALTRYHGAVATDDLGRYLKSVGGCRASAAI
jgi:hypothetical protein